VKAKGLEDTAFYRYNRLVSLNEVGGNPNKFGTTVEEFHRANRERQRYWPHSMLALSTHDTKRSEDVRARINALSEIPAAWRLRLQRWRSWNRSKKRLFDDQFAPSRNDEYLLYQTLVGTWPSEVLDDASWHAFSERIQQYMLKAAREAKVHTSWANQNIEYEAALSAFIEALLDRSPRNRFLGDFASFHRPIARAGIFNSLSQTLLKLTAPGVPDTYQGNELWRFSLVDPDNRRPVDYEHRRGVLEELQHKFAPSPELHRRVNELLSNAANGKIKMYLLWRALNVRKANAQLFQHGNYVPLPVSGIRAQHVCAFAREHQGMSAIVAVPRLCATLLGESGETPCDESMWGDTRIMFTGADTACYQNIFTGECNRASTGENSLSIGTLFRNFPVALLVHETLPC
jgi:(1->4)-alpha-D-glucan 1-alpha-D-glucosylmutase